MNTKVIAVLLSGVVIGVAGVATRADDDRNPSRLPTNATFTTLTVTDLAIEGLTGDAYGNLYTTGRATAPENCPVWKISSAIPSSPPHTVVGFIPNNPAPNACNPSGITFDGAGNLYVADAASGGIVWTLTPNEANPPLAKSFATGAPGTNGLAFDRSGNLWTGDGTTGQGRVWRIARTGGACEPTFIGCKEIFRIQPMSNEMNLVLGTGGVGRDVRALPPGTIIVTPTSRNAANTAGSQPLVANGVAFDREGDLYIADTARGAIWKAEFHLNGDLRSAIGCDTTFTANTLCLDSVFVAHPYLEGTDGIALDREGNIWSSANERNAIVVVTKHGSVVELFRTPVNAARLRNSADPGVGNDHILEFPTSPFLLGKKFCTSNSDGDRRDNSPRAAGEINAGGPVGRRGKISCMDQELPIRGLPLPIR
jgi:sugar lactone lactonase YvrE